MDQGGADVGHGHPVALPHQHDSAELAGQGDGGAAAVLAPEPPLDHQVLGTDLVIGGSCGC